MGLAVLWVHSAEEEPPAEVGPPGHSPETEPPGRSVKEAQHGHSAEAGPPGHSAEFVGSQE